VCIRYIERETDLIDAFVEGFDWSFSNVCVSL
jgi:hypothetical protein